MLKSLEYNTLGFGYEGVIRIIKVQITEDALYNSKRFLCSCRSWIIHKQVITIFIVQD